MFKFIKSSTNLDNWYEHPNYEIAFWGRSNVGKSSLLNAITGTRSLARVSKTPGRTQLLNFFENEYGAVIVDLPGYGYAKISNSQKLKMLDMINEYLLKRQNLKRLFVLIDARHGITKTDEEILDYLNQINQAFTLVFTKADKLKQKDKSALAKKIKIDSKRFGFTQYFIVSSETNFGINELTLYINDVLGGKDESAA
ncbi:ribosome biogenesis GTP-binding protein YihA/YsxC [Mycoplasmopsis gallopavonis]|uniref:Probable GTP-binding protein EngB n=1 Tax=Mycoplasmopsis gallopavonis TaxID=76629 RepID=A0A449AZG9_9BACT|nr:ribosome biogenesis GTP-binding protein YihA/YsxC [Mycoplasmopsis gallopavonis]RIV16787.1 YihA family ribosome biogenesis GTP-binding protein [Mycoplasmopsis gallopavonis]VEU72910.1 ribosome biogenesis GTP-binding protein YsxC [Mycoplasmopsis gallopavonis]